ncbi:hypothetical protein BCV69DRAFT_293591 [Microstroma glucosiphilum]|uniref:Myb-like domain-containing protein n=1 Tax=Pseudomicrostroma glucosiphilum TaxID=1684307 RepID=A0A316U9C2_9BASI|nr:hypothetical protein BCV69DRAFT_293591 [Pseudomicrostroma glucosiphilum]PWN20983.1 hypothetical protein BCV69DRAFT_293591 [Pseudomicrostroma glucosiphilum]
MTADTDEEEEREAQELTFLLEQRRSIALARESNASLQETLVETLKQAPLAQAELDGIGELLDLADAMHSYDTARSSILPSQPFLQASLPLFHGLEKVTSVAAEVSDLKALLLNSIWNKADDRCLEEAVLNQCRRLAAYTFKADKSCRDPLALVAQMSDEELALLSLPKYLRPMQGGDSADESSEDESEAEDAKGESRKRKAPQRIDWDEISLSLSAAPTANAHTADACRTRWLMVARPGINDEPWSEKEIERLKTLVEKQLNTSAGNDRLDWHNVADEIGNGRRPIDCLIAYQRLPFVVRSAPHLSLPSTFDQKEAYDDELLRQASIWGHQWSLLAEKLNYNPSTIIDKFDTALESENEAREWDENEIQRLREGIARQTDQVRLPLPTTQDEALPGSSRSRSQDQGPLMTIENLNFERVARYVRTRTPKACQDRYANLIAPPATSQAARPLPEQPSSTGWTLSEERQLLTLREQHPEWLWVEIARTLTKGRTKGKKITGTMAIDRWMELKGLEGDEERQEIKRADTLIRGARDRKRQREKDALARSATEQRTMEGSVAEQQPATIQSREGGDTFNTQPEPAKKKRRGQRQT